MKQTHLICICWLLIFSIQTASTQNPVGVLSVNISGVPAGVNSSLKMTGPKGFARILQRSEKLTNLEDGVYEFTSEVIIQREPLISKAFRLNNLQMKHTIKRDTQSINFVYRQMPGSDKIWLGNQTAPAGQNLHIQAYSNENITSTSTIEPSVRLTSRVTSLRWLAFDDQGNLWTADAGNIKMYAWNTLGDTNVGASITIAHEATCLAFDADGNLWFSDGKKASKIMRIPKARLNQSGGNKTDITLSGPSFDGAQGIAFDRDGNLWAGNYNKSDVVKIPRAMLAESNTAVDGLTSITCESKPPVVSVLRAPKALAFDKQGNLWVGYFGPNVIAQIPANQLNQTTKFKPDIQITLSVGVLLQQMAFDEDGSLWTALSGGSFGKINSTQLTSGGKLTPEVIIKSNQLKYGSGLAIYPPPLNFPLKQ